jgi:hypothetical protein
MTDGQQGDGLRGDDVSPNMLRSEADTAGDMWTVI